MNPDRVKWGDSRIDDAIRRLDDRIDDVQNEVRANRDLPKAMVEMAGQISRLADSVESLHEDQIELRGDFKGYVEERKSFNRFIITITVAVLSILVAAGGILASHVS